MLIDVVTTFPEMFTPLNVSMIGRAQEKGLFQLRFFNPRDYSDDPHRKTDAPQYGGSDGMVMCVEPLVRAVEDALSSSRADDSLVLFPSPQGQLFDQQTAHAWSQREHLVVVCGHYKGVDERFVELMQPLEVSVGNYVLTGGELPAMAIIDATVRLIPDVVGGFESVREDSFFMDGLLECPRYTRPRVFRGLDVPSVLLSGNHDKIQAWRKRMAVETTRRKRPDLLQQTEKAAGNKI